MSYALLRRWPLLASVGVVTSVFGVGLLHQPLGMLKGLLLAVGVAMICLGLAVICIPPRWAQGSDAFIGAGCCILCGVVSLVTAALSPTVLAYLFAVQCLVAGSVQIAIAVDIRAHVLLATLLVVCALASILLGVALFVAPIATLLTLIALCGACCFVGGLLLLTVAAYVMAIAN